MQTISKENDTKTHCQPNCKWSYCALTMAKTNSQYLKDINPSNIWTELFVSGKIKSKHDLIRLLCLCYDTIRNDLMANFSTNYFWPNIKQTMCIEENGSPLFPLILIWRSAQFFSSSDRMSLSLVLIIRSTQTTTVSWSKLMKVRGESWKPESD